MPKIQANFPIFAQNYATLTGAAMKIIILSVALILAAVLLLGVKALFVKGGSFPSGHVHDIKALKKNRNKKKHYN